MASGLGGQQLLRVRRHIFVDERCDPLHGVFQVLPLATLLDYLEGGKLLSDFLEDFPYGLFHRPFHGKVEPTEIARRIVRPQKPTDKFDAIREAVLELPIIF